MTRRGFLAMTALTLVACSHTVPARRGSFAFHYQPSLSEDALAWYSRFDILVTHDPLPRVQVDRLHAAGTKLVLYEWSVAFYESRATDWQRSLGEWDLLNRTALTGGAGPTTSGAWYFDPASPEHATGRADDIARRITDAGYDGVFFDTTTFASVHADAKKEYERRHPETPYDAAFSRFLRELRNRLPNGILFTNQGYRAAEHYLPYVDWDLTESLITRPVDGSSRLRPWNDPNDPWNSIHFVMQEMIEPIAARYPHVHFGHLNYANEATPDTIRVVAAVARLFGGEGYVAAPAVLDEVDAIYFRDPGEPVGPRIDVADGKASYRVFQHGVVAVTSATDEIKICGGAITLPAAPLEPHAWFFDAAKCRR